MPTYEYKCTGCSHAFEQFQSMRDGALRKCPKCGRLRLERLIGTGAAVIFKGSGFYQTDYRSEAYKKSAETDTKAAEPKTETKTETKTDTKAEAKSGEAKVEAKPATPKVEAKPAPEPKAKRGSAKKRR